MKKVFPNVLILSSRFDLSCEFIMARLAELSATYLRLNSEDLAGLEVFLDPIKRELRIESCSKVFLINDKSLESIYFRRPVYLREYGVPFTIEEQHSRVQWAAFMRNLMVFDSCVWMNHPGATYVAEHKAIQLRAAYELGFAIPSTSIQNSKRIDSSIVDELDRLVIKGLDTVLARTHKTEIFGFTHVVTRKEILNSEVAAAPITMQELIETKVDIRVTVVRDKVFSVAILNRGKGVHGDWRLRKESVSYEQIFLPPDVILRCVSLLKKLGLNFGAIDLALRNGTYYFLEINPTGEWAWLLESAGADIDMIIAKFLAGHKL